MKPGIVKIPLTANTDLEITLLANLISLTPGTLSLDVSDDRKVLYVHAMYVKDREQFILGIKNGFEKKLLEIIR
jgi:multicomponent Na+:H+ antiporter subunit E